MRRLVGGLLLLLSVNYAIAHHGLDGYNTAELVELEGRVIDFTLMDPHSVLVVETENADGTVSVWSIEGGSASGIIESGLSQEFLRSGPTVRIKAFQSKDARCTPRCSAAGRDFDFGPAID